MATEANTQSFWEHLDVLRAAIIKIVAVAVVFGIVVFFFKEQLFGVVLVPKDDGFITYQLTPTVCVIYRRSLSYNVGETKRNN